MKNEVECQEKSHGFWGGQRTHYIFLNKVTVTISTETGIGKPLFKVSEDGTPMPVMIKRSATLRFIPWRRFSRVGITKGEVNLTT